MWKVSPFSPLFFTPQIPSLATKLPNKAEKYTWQKGDGDCQKEKTDQILADFLSIEYLWLRNGY